MTNSDNPAPFGEPNNAPHRVVILIAGITLLASLGSVYAWSFFSKILQATYHWSNMQTSLVFSLAVAGLGFSALYTGPYVSKLGGRHLMKRATKFFVAGNFIAALGLYLGGGVLGPVETPWINHLSFGLLALGYGAIGGIGLGTGYVTAVSTVSGWFPDKKGLATGLIVMGFGLGALFMSKVFAPLAMSLTGGDVALSFLFLGIFFAIIMTIACQYIYSPHAAVKSKAKPTVGESMEYGQSVRVRLWLICFLYSVAGLGIISLLSPLMQSMMSAADPAMDKVALAAAGATLIAIASIGNSLGRLLWAGLSDYIGRVNVFLALLSTAACAYLVLPYVSSPFLFGLLICFAISTYGGGFGTIPSLISDLYGVKRMSAMHGLVLTGWATAGLISPTFFGILYDRLPAAQATQIAYGICAAVLVVATVIVASLRSAHQRAVTPVEEAALAST
ncbi:MFS transporter [Chitinibacter sp. SCUT-21]|uniref:MFS transporter n=1 Tax=Chitinibacter sp. SCUT-21 TaxID=2970891 RepID=UPI0035A6A1EB